MFQRFADILFSQRDRWVLWLPVVLAAGTGAYFSLPAEPTLWLGPAGLLGVAAAMAAFYRNKTARLLLLPFLLATLGFTAAQLRTASLDTVMLERKTWPLIIEGRVGVVEPLAAGKTRMVVEVARYTSEKYPDKPLPQARMPQKIRISIKKDDTPPAAGDNIRVRAMLLPVSGPTMPGAYDFQRHMFYRGLGATGFAIGNIEIVEKRESGGYFFENLRRKIGANISAAMTNPDAAAITTALLDGEDQNISKGTYDKIRTAGLAHLIAISGLQITLVTGFFFFVVRGLLAAIPYVALRWPVKKITAFLAALGAVFYMMLIGDSISAERSVIMVCAAMGAIMIDRDPFTLRMAAFAAAVILLFQPENLFGPGFQMSFAAVVALIAFYEATRDWWMAQHAKPWPVRFSIYIFASMATTLIATLATAPIALYHFLRTPLLAGLLANLVAVPLSSFVTLPAAIIGSLLAPFGLAGIPFKIAEVSALGLMKTADVFARQPYALHHADAWPLGLLVVITLGGLWICLWRGPLRWAGLVPLLAGLALIPFSPRADVLASTTAKSFAVRDEAGRLLLSPGRAEKFVRNDWLAREGGQGHGLWVEKDAPPPDAIKCDAKACLYRARGHAVSFVKDYAALAADCAVADVVISTLQIDRALCPGPRLIYDKWGFRRTGALALSFKPDGKFDVKTLRDARGQRPWTPKSY